MWGDYQYVSVAEKKAKAMKSLERLKKNNKDLEPVIINGRKVATTWWGMSWNKNLESYADYSNRIGRGRSYARNGYVLDLKIKTGEIVALVQGSERKPYTIEIEIEPLSTKKWEKLLEKCSHQIDSLSALASGEFPIELEELFMTKENGLFPSPKEIKFDCSCPDWAYMCKHVAAVLYGIGARLDEAPLLFFKLRDIDFEALLKKSVEEKMENLLQNADNKTDRVIDDLEMEDLFGL